MSYEQYKQAKLNFIKDAQAQIQRRQKRRLLYEQQNAISKVESMDKAIQSVQQHIQLAEQELSLCRPEKPEDIAERQRIYETYAKTIQRTFSDDNPVLFHGVRDLASLEPILSGGTLGGLSGIDVTGFNTIQITLEEFVGVNPGYIQRYPFLPATCLFVIAPKNEREKHLAQLKAGAGIITSFDFKKNPERLLAIVSSTENQEYIKNLCQKYGISTDLVHTFDGFIEHAQKNKGKDLATPQKPSITAICKAGQDRYEASVQREAANRNLPEK